MTLQHLDYYQDSPSLRVIDALAAVTDTDPLELPPLYEVIDPEALDALFRPDSGVEGTVQFTFGPHEITVRSDGTVAIDDTEFDT